jgi:hypothetical protein
MLILRHWLFIPILASTLLFAAAPVVLDVGGTVQDPSGASVAGAKITLRPDSGGEARPASTDVTGRFRFAAVGPGQYELSAETPGFKPALVKLRVGTRSPAPIRIVLSLADLRERVTVNGGAGQLSTETSENLDTVRLDRTALSGLPILGNDIVGAASALLDSSALGAGGVSMVVDGMETSEKGVTASAIQEVRINQNPYSAEYARPGRGRLEVITKPGTKEYHGDVNFLFRDSIFDARNAFAASRPNEQRRIFEGNLTGPMGKSGKGSFVISGNHENENLESLVYALTPRGEVRSNFPQPQRQDEWNGKLTRQIGKRHTIAVRYEFQDEGKRGENVGGFSLPETAADFTERQHHLYFNYRGALTSRLVSEFALRGGRHDGGTVSRLEGVPSIVVMDAFTAGGAQANQRSTENHVQFTGTTLYTRGKHLLKFGISVPDFSRRGSNDRSNTDGTFTFSSLADHARGAPFSYSVQRGDGYLVLWQKEFGLFFQDDFKLRPNLSLALGLRYDWQNYLADHNNFAPRLSIAWSPGRNRKTVIRGGAGVFYDRTGERAIGDTLRFDGSHLRRMLVENPGYPDPLPPGASLTAQPAGIVRFARDLREPYLTQYSAGVERQLDKSLTLTATYTGILGVKMFRSRDVNAPPPPLYTGRPDPAIGVLRQMESAGRLASRSLEVGLRGSITRHFKGIAQYTGGRAWNNTGGINALPANSYNLTREWSPAPFDMRHRFTLMGVLRPEKLLHLGLRLGWNTGTPYSLTTGRDDNRDGYASDRPAGAPRNSLRGPGAANLDLRWSREFPLTRGGKDEGPAVSLDLDAFNALNHVNCSNMVGNLSSPFFGTAVAARPARQMQLGLEFKF